MPPFTKSKTTLEPQLGLYVASDDVQRFDAAIALAMSYRGDVTLILRENDEPLAGYLYDLKRSGDHDDRVSIVRIMPQDESPRRSIPVAEIKAIEFTGRDTASGKSFDTWMKKYVEQRLAGRRAAIESEPLE